MLHLCVKLINNNIFFFYLHYTRTPIIQTPTIRIAFRKKKFKRESYTAVRKIMMIHSKESEETGEDEDYLSLEGLRNLLLLKIPGL